MHNIYGYSNTHMRISGRCKYVAEASFYGGSAILLLPIS
jgi:hypothetical protein